MTRTKPENRDIFINSSFHPPFVQTSLDSRQTERLLQIKKNDYTLNSSIKITSSLNIQRLEHISLEIS
jgi:hypothetical protein